ncbi:MAG TPA: presqualene diphosphate synthase HpnD [Verrucomicrobiota bacterium]|nr:presqualene diphosphate synthase HpnD [Verrucomicrobiota bacterium]HNT14090.1 presqualene diphosphate synthase HpnD [Verrucomicrobiota bacterium]
MQHSQTITRQSASNLALAFILLAPPRRHAMAALYAFCRQVDDVADEDRVPVADRRARLAEWRADVQRACTDASPRFPVNQELQPVIRAFHLPFTLFDELIQGCEMDLETRRYATAADLRLYCHRVASVVGLLSIEIFGYQNSRCRDYALALGQALQLTNILRDVRNDAERGRIYLPLADLEAHRVSEAEILQGRYSARYAELAEAVAARARHYYRQARDTLPREDQRAMVAAELMGAVYWRLLEKLQRHRFNVFTPAPLRLSRAVKLRLIWRSWWRHGFRCPRSDYGDVA